MTTDFSIGDATKYKAIVQGNTIIINDLEKFLEDWKEHKEKAELWDKWKPVTCIELLDKLEAVKTHIKTFPKYQRPLDYTNKTKFPHWDLDQMNSALKVDRDKWFQEFEKILEG